MNRYKITVEYEFVTKSSITKFVISKSREEAEKSVLDTMNPESIKVTGVETSFIPYRTDKWRDLEDLLFEDIQDEDIQYILDQLIDKEFKKAAIRYKSLDFLNKNKIPDRIYDLFSDLGLL